MPPAAKHRPNPVAIAILAAGALVLALGAAELFLRLFVGSPKPLGELSYATADGKAVTFLDAVKRGLIVATPGPLPMDRPRAMFAPDQRFFLCYSDHERLRRDWFDDRGRVEVRINHWGLRERDEITPKKPPGQRRIVCIGDSFTFGWGIPEDRGWARRLEVELQKTSGDVCTVNCGAAGAVCVDEYWFGLQHRFRDFQPDAVILTICLNDLIPSSGLNVLGPSPATSIRVVDLVLGALGKSPLQLDPDRDWVGELLALPRDQALASGLATAHTPEHPASDKPFEAMWSQGVPQRSLREAKAWCVARQIPFLVVLWPFLQGLGPGRHYPFQKLHDLVAADCRDAGIPFLDVLPALRDTPEEDLWVTPADPHPNPRANDLALPAIVAFVRTQTTW
ncbi:MAG: SGNH/GDSL hydrolase family protein [Planctomycetota bacterium]